MARGLTSPARLFSFVCFVLFVVIIPVVFAHNSRLVRQAGGSLP